jgi:hypothetical protein
MCFIIYTNFLQVTSKYRKQQSCRLGLVTVLGSDGTTEESVCIGYAHAHCHGVQRAMDGGQGKMYKNKKIRICFHLAQIEQLNKIHTLP